MGRLAGFRYRDIIKILKKLGFEFHRQAAGSHEIWFNTETKKFTTIPNHAGDMPEGSVSDGEKQAIVCLDHSLAQETVDALKKLIDEKVVVIERALDTTQKWNLHDALGEKFKAF